MERLTTFVLAGGKGTRLAPLTHRRAKPAVPFAGQRLIDFTLASCSRSALDDVTVLTQYLGPTVARHVRERWADRVGVLSSRAIGRPFLGTADAVRAALGSRPAGDLVLVLAGDHVYDMDYRWLLTTHLMAEAEATLSVARVTPESARGLGVVAVGPDGLATGFAENPASPPDAPFANMGIYLFERRALEDMLAAHPDAMDFGHGLIPRIIAEGRRVAARRFAKPWKDIADVDSYFEAHASYARRRDGSYVWPAARIAPSAQIEDCIVLGGAEIGRGAVLRRVIVEEGVRIPAHSRIGFDPEEDAQVGYVSPAGVTVVTAGPVAAATLA